MRKVVINDCFGGFSVSLAAGRRMAELGQAAAVKEVAEYDSNLAEWQRTGVNPQFAEVASIPLQKWEPRWHGYLYGDDNAGIARDDPVLVQVVEEMGDDAGGDFAHLKIVEIPADVEWHVEEYDGNEHVAEDHRVWS